MPDFRFTLPTLIQLTLSQQIALMSEDAILVTGGPGSGKTVVSIRRLLRLKLLNKNVKLFTFNRTLMSAIRGLARSEDFDTDIVESFYDWYYTNTRGIFANDDAAEIARRFKQYSLLAEVKFDELILDESQDFEHKIISGLSELANSVSCGADRDQDIKNIYDNNAEEQILEILGNFQTTNEYLLEQNFRNTKEIFAFSRRFVPNNPRPHRIDVNKLPTGDMPEIYDKLDIDQQLKKIHEIVILNQNNSNIGILVHFPKEIEILRNFFIANGVEYSYYYNKMDKNDRLETESRLQTPLIATYASCKGLEFDIVIMPFFDTAEWSMKKGHTIANHYYVGATRARRQLFLFYNTKPTILNSFDANLYRLNGSQNLFEF